MGTQTPEVTWLPLIGCRADMSSPGTRIERDGLTSVSPSKAPTVEPRSNITGRCICNETGVIFFELPNVVEDSNLPVHLPTQCSDPIGARGPLAPASSLSISRAFYDPQQTKLPWMHVESA